MFTKNYGSVVLVVVVCKFYLMNIVSWVTTYTSRSKVIVTIKIDIDIEATHDSACESLPSIVGDTVGGPVHGPVGIGLVVGGIGSQHS
jgi:hypothetical protein